MARAFAICCACVFALSLTGCGDEGLRPIPRVIITALPQTQWRIDGAVVDRAGLDRELRRIADAHRDSVTRNVRVYVHINQERGSRMAQVDDAVDLCSRLGINQIQVTGQ